MTEIQRATIMAMRFDDTSRQIAKAGLVLTWDEVTDLGEVRVAWLQSRLGLTRDTSEGGLILRPKVQQP